jgi:hypothetical protein
MFQGLLSFFIVVEQGLKIVGKYGWRLSHYWTFGAFLEGHVISNEHYVTLASIHELCFAFEPP